MKQEERNETQKNTGGSETTTTTYSYSKEWSDQPIDSQENFQLAVKFGDAPLQSKDKFDHAKDYILLLDKQIGVVEITCQKAGTKVSVGRGLVLLASGSHKAAAVAEPAGR